MSRGWRYMRVGRVDGGSAVRRVCRDDGDICEWAECMAAAPVRRVSRVDGEICECAGYMAAAEYGGSAGETTVSSGFRQRRLGECFEWKEAAPVRRRVYGGSAGEASMSRRCAGEASVSSRMRRRQRGDCLVLK